MSGVFISYAHEDRHHLEALTKQLGWLKHSKQVHAFEDGQVRPGSDWDKEIKAALDAADIFLPLVTPSFVGSRYCTVTEMVRALDKGTHTIPVYVEHVDFEGLPLSAKAALPMDEQQNLVPICVWPKNRQSEAWAQVAKAVREYVESRPSSFAPPRSLPRFPIWFTGREKELAQLEKHLFDHENPITLHSVGGMGGVGKTALAIVACHRLAPRFPDGVVFIDLLGFADRPALTVPEAMTAVLRALGIEDKLPDDPAQLSRLYTQVLDGKRLLLVLDNARNEDHAEPLLPPPSVACLVTSRTNFKLKDGKFLNLDRLESDDAQALLREALEERQASEEDLRELAEATGRLPIVLNTAASFLEMNPFVAIADYARTLRGAAGEGMERVKIQLSHSLDVLDEDDPALAARFAVLAVFPAGFDAAAVAAVWDVADETQGLAALYERSLVLVEGAGVAARWRLHDLYRELAAGRLEPDQRKEAARRHSRHYCHVLERCQELYLQGGEAVLTGLRLFDLERGNIEAGQAWAAARWQEDDEAAGLAARYPNGWHVLVLRLHSEEQVRWYKTAVHASRRLRWKEAESASLGNLGLALARLGKLEEAIDAYASQSSIAEDLDGRIHALGNFGLTLLQRGRNLDAVQVFRKCFGLARSIGNDRLLCNTYGNFGGCSLQLQKFQQASRFFARQRRLALRIGDQKLELNALDGLVDTLSPDENPQLIDRWMEHEKLANALGDQKHIAKAMFRKAFILEGDGERKQAIQHARASLNIYRDLYDPMAQQVAIWLRERGIDPDSVE